MSPAGRRWIRRARYGLRARVEFVDRIEGAINTSDIPLPLVYRHLKASMPAHVLKLLSSKPLGDFFFFGFR